MNRQVFVIPHDQFEEVDHPEKVTEQSLFSVVRCLVAERPEKKRISYPAFYAIPLDIDQKPIGETHSIYPGDVDDRYKTFMEVLDNAGYISGMFKRMYGFGNDGLFGEAYNLSYEDNDPVIDSFVYVVSTQYGFDIHDMRALTLALTCMNAIPDNVHISAFVVSTDIDFYIVPSFTSLM
jgi:hypothetical protein